VRFTDNDKLSYKNAKVLIVDTIGHLSSLYNYGNIAYIGGGFGKGIHNILEAATYGLPVIFGPNFKKFLEAVEMVELKAAFSITSFDDLKKVIDQFITDEKMLSSCSQTAMNYVKSRLGATNLIVDQALGNIKK
jgi:3-deoxy-D-manno-octulosonic-acid transferase